MERQLIKVAKELNIGMGSIVEFLTDKGFDVENKPNAKLSDGMYDALMKKFSDSKAEKQKADQLVIGTRPVVKPITPPAVHMPPQVPPIHEKKTISLFPPKETPITEDKPAEKSAPEVIERASAQMPRVLGKIDLTPQKKEPVSPPKTEPVVKQPEQPVSQEKQQPVNPQQVTSQIGRAHV